MLCNVVWTKSSWYSVASKRYGEDVNTCNTEHLQDPRDYHLLCTISVTASTCVTIQIHKEPSDASWISFCNGSRC
jgi:hypothetical protein